LNGELVILIQALLKITKVCFGSIASVV